MSLKQEWNELWRDAGLNRLSRRRPRRRWQARSNRSSRTLEALEERCLLAASILTPSDQLMLEFMNRARANPSAEAARQGIGLNTGVTGTTISTAAKQPLAPNNLLDAAANGHTDDMLARGFFAHISPAPNSTNFDARVTSAGYSFTLVGENLALQEYNSLNQTTVVTQMHDGLYASPGHRVNMMQDGFFEVGVGVDFGGFTDTNNVLGQGAGRRTTVGATTIKFAAQTARPYITGVVYTDASDGSAADNSFYSIGEAAGGGGTVTATDTTSGATFSDAIGAAGGYSLQVPAGTYNVTVSGGGLAQTYGQNNVAVGTANRKVDFETTTASTATVVLAAPNITTTPNSTTTDARFPLTWDAVAGANRYEVTYTRVATGEANFVNEFPIGTSFTPSSDLPLGRYNIWVRVNGSDGASSPWSSPIQVRVDATPTINSLATNQTTQRPTISWSAVTGATRYEVWGTNVTSQVARAFNDTNVTSATFTPTADLDMGVYRVWVRAYDASGLAATWSASEVFHIGPQLVAPIAPTFANTPQFSWTAVSGSATYQLYVQRGGTVVINETGITSTTFTPASALASGSYRWWVRPFASSGRSGAWSSLGEFNVDGRPVVLSPTGTRGDGAPTITWTPVATASSYEVYLFNDDLPGLVIRHKDITGTTFAAPALADGNYRVWVRSFRADGSNGTWSRPASFVVDAASVSLPIILVSPLAPTLDDTPEFRWNAVSGAASYEIYLHNGSTALSQSGITGTSYTPGTSLAAGEWNWWVRAVTLGGAFGSWSNQGSTDVTGRPVLNGPTGSTADTTPLFTWSAVHGATRYSLQVNTLTGGNTVSIRENHVTTNSFTAESALMAGVYRFWVQAIGGTSGDRSPWSFSVDFTITNLEAQPNDNSGDNPQLLAGLLADEPDHQRSQLNKHLRPEDHRVSRQQTDDAAAINLARPLPGSGHHEIDTVIADIDKIMRDLAS